MLPLACFRKIIYNKGKGGIAVLADKSGYTSYHLSRKFKQEMKRSIIDYIPLSKLENTGW